MEISKLEGAELREKGITVLEIDLVPNSSTADLKNLLPILTKHKDDTLTPSELIKILGKEITLKIQFLTGHKKNGIPVFCRLLRWSLGDMVYFLKFQEPDFKIDIAGEIENDERKVFMRKKQG
jgi:deoxyhypusine synthase